ncbi:unnamed protein product [Staurois parvus]|uniref:Uncharacterized protein n=1 Tax=Staurois parvus TaxID=386267 RepID=A0ABN9BNG0_9NEOB|nr:unnamed protein product [Staurois parvus]
MNCTTVPGAERSVRCSFNHFNTGQFYTFLPRPVFRFQRSHILNDNCAVIQHCTQTKILSFSSHN